MHPSITIKTVEEAVRAQMFGVENPGFCKACGERHESCEPDARNYRCESCGKNEVFGAQELLFELA